MGHWRCWFKVLGQRFLFMQCNWLWVLWNSWSRGPRVGAGGGQRVAVAHGLSPRPAGRGPVRRTRPQLHRTAPERRDSRSGRGAVLFVDRQEQIRSRAVQGFGGLQVAERVGGGVQRFEGDAGGEALSERAVGVGGDSRGKPSSPARRRMCPLATVASLKNRFSHTRPRRAVSRSPRESAPAPGARTRASGTACPSPAAPTAGTAPAVAPRSIGGARPWLAPRRTAGSSAAGFDR